MNKNKGFIGIGLILAIVLGIAVVGGGAYYVGKSKGENKEEKIWFEGDDLIITDDQNKKLQKVDQNQPVIENKVLEESPSEFFTKQPGAIKSIKSDGNNKWILAVDLLSNNPKWIPGDDSTGGFFINQNTKIRNLNITSLTKIQNCSTQYSGYASGFENNLSSFITYFNKKIGNPKEVGEFGYTAYFDISGTNITAIYEQCLP